MGTTFFSQLNWLAILAATIAYFILGAIWYSKALFANKWVVLHKIDMNDPDIRKGLGALMFGSFIMMVVITLGLAILIERIQLHFWMSGLKLGLITGGAFAFTAISINNLYTRKPLTLHLIDGGYHLVGHIIAAIILCVWQ